MNYRKTRIRYKRTPTWKRHPRKLNVTRRGVYDALDLFFYLFYRESPVKIPKRFIFSVNAGTTRSSDTQHRYALVNAVASILLRLFLWIVCTRVWKQRSSPIRKRLDWITLIYSSVYDVLSDSPGTRWRGARVGIDEIGWERNFIPMQLVMI